LEQWRQALSDGVTDAKLCYSYALLADESGVSIAEVKETLQRAIELEPGFDDARYKLALLENNSGNYQLSIDQLKAMKVPNGARAFTYWTTLASALTELDQRDQAMAAAHEALKWAHTDSEKLRARQLAFIAATDLTVQFETDAEGHRRMVTTRVQHGTTDWNPFIESSDRIQHTAGVLTEVLCSAGKLDGFVIRGANGPVTVGVPDPLHVLIRNGPKDFYCGRVAGWNVKADYAMTDGSGRTRNILRGMTFDSSAELQ
jgi:tetratricopeptide (TPR) repeat protein